MFDETNVYYAKKVRICLSLALLPSYFSKKEGYQSGQIILIKKAYTLKV
jgi:hypothetical protein